MVWFLLYIIALFYSSLDILCIIDILKCKVLPDIL